MDDSDNNKCDIENKKSFGVRFRRERNCLKNGRRKRKIHVEDE